MPTYAPKPTMNTTYEPVPAGTHIATLYKFVEIGTVEEEYLGEVKALPKISLSFEFPNKMKVLKEGEPEKPMVLSREFTFSMGPKANLRKFVEGMIGTALKDEEAYNFDIEKLVGKSCLISVIHKTKKNGGTRAEITTAAPLVEGMTNPPQFNKSTILSYSNWNDAVFEALPQFIKDKMITTPEYANKMTPEEKEDIKKTKEMLRAAQNEFDAKPDHKTAFDDINPEDIPFN